MKITFITAAIFLILSPSVAFAENCATFEKPGYKIIKIGPRFVNISFKADVINNCDFAITAAVKWDLVDADDFVLKTFLVVLDESIAPNATGKARGVRMINRDIFDQTKIYNAKVEFYQK